MKQFFIALLLLFAGIVMNSLLSHGERYPLKTHLSQFPTTLESWEGVEVGIEPQVLTKLGATEVLMRRYVTNNIDNNYRVTPIWLYIGYYQSQREGITYHSPKNCLPGSGWQIIQSERVSIPVGRNQKVLVNKVLIQKGLEKELVFYWYHDRGRIITSEYWAKIYMVYDAITRNRTDGAMVRISASVMGSGEKTMEGMIGFTQRVFFHLEEFIPA